MDDYSKEQLEDALFAFMAVIGDTLIAFDETQKRKVIVKTFMELGKQVMERRLNEPDKRDVKRTLPRLWAGFENMMRKGKYKLEVQRGIDKMFEGEE